MSDAAPPSPPSSPQAVQGAPLAIASPFFLPLAEDLVERAARATVSQMAPANRGLARHLLSLLERMPGQGHSYLAPPVMEALFEWEQSGTPVEHLRTPDGAPLLPRAVVDALDGAEGDQRFPRDRHPYVHQERAWRSLLGTPPRSVIVSTGTASGKTECFLVPILADLAREIAEARAGLVGVRAIFLYPLNALINSQRERLSAWTRPFGSRLRFCLFNGLTRETVPDAEAARTPHEVLSRRTLRASPPPILVTNATMLEYMLVRRLDRPIIDSSQGTLRWIVLDEAHTYVGSAAAEIALLMRRVLHAFGANAEQVRFVATSATIGGDEARDGLRSYLADLAGVAPDRVEVITGRRQLPDLPSQFVERNEPLPSLEDLAGLTPIGLFERLGAVPSVRVLRQRLAQGPLRLPSVNAILAGADPEHHVLDDVGTRLTLGLLDSLTAARDAEGVHLLPVRAHLFHRAQPGLWACMSNACPGRAGTPLEPAGQGWRFGKTFFERRVHCDECESLVLELVLCRSCGADYLVAGDDGTRLVARPWRAPDVEGGNQPDADDGEEDEDEEGEAPDVTARVLLCGRTLPDEDGAPDDEELEVLQVDPSTGEYGGAGSGRIAFQVAPSNDGRAQCPNCGQGERRGYELVRSVQLGAPFYLATAVPALLERVPEGIRNPAVRPLRGRRLLTFTDSRQGTARFTARLELDGERRWTRSMVYHHLWSRVSPPAAPEDLDRLDAQILELTALVATRPVLQSVLDQCRREREELSQRGQRPAASVPWRDLVDHLAQEATVGWIRRARLDAYRPADLSERDWARVLLMRELLRRPRRQTSLETLGLVALQYPGLDRVVQVPREWAARTQNLATWRDFLTMCLDFFVRAHVGVSFPPDLSRWLGTAASFPVITDPDGEHVRNRQYPWPAVRPRRRLPRLGRLLAFALGLDSQDQDDRATIDSLLRRAWLDIVPLLTPFERGYRLDMEAEGRVTVRLVRDAWLCPVTGRVLTTTLLRRSPYQVDLPQLANVECTPISMPRLPFPYRRQDGSQVTSEAIRAWLSSAEVVASRGAGAWAELSDRIASFADYVRASEHSAQIPAQRLRNLEEQFREGQINVLGCSTTMEMGVDIGGLSAVVMNNAPPGPANFLQRAGRAGRRGEARAASLTLCQSVPHGEAVFRDPTWPFTTPIHVPRVSLWSERIVQRHVQALCLGQFLANELDDDEADGLRITCDWFFTAGGPDLPSRSDRFEAWLVTDAPNDPTLDAGMRRLVARSCLEGAPRDGLLANAAAAIRDVAEQWRSEEGVLAAELEEVGGEPGSDRQVDPVQRALAAQLRRMRGEYLLGSLATAGFLPGHGFPIHVVPFVTTTAEELRDRDERRREERERDEPYNRSRSYPSRQLPVAIREYAPGSGVVIGGVVYRSEGVTLNWRLPPDADRLHEVQSLRWAWRCSVCAAVGTAPLRPDGCPACGEGEGLSRLRTLLPAGFAVDIRARPNIDLSQQRWIPVNEPWISAGTGPWMVVAPGTASVRYAADGSIVYRSGGEHGFGYAVCLRCGRASSERGPATETDIPNELSDHDRLRGGRDEGGGRSCPGNGTFAIQRNLWLGGEERTDVVEVRLTHPTSGVVNDDAACTTIAVALCQALAEDLGIEPREVGWSTTVAVEGGAPRRSIVIFDAAQGGAGYVAHVPDNLVNLLRRAREILSCPRGCDGACHGCLLTHETQHAAMAGLLDRHCGLRVLDDVLFEAMALRPELQVFGPDTRLESLTLTEAIGTALQRHGVSAIRVHLSGSPTEWDFSAWPLWSLLSRRASEGMDVTLCLTQETLGALGWDTARFLAARVETGEFDVLVAQASMSAGTAQVAAELRDGDGCVRWAVIGAPHVLAPGETWGQDAQVLVRARVDGELPDVSGGRLLRPQELRRPTPVAFREIAISQELDGAITGLGSRFLGLVVSRAPGLIERLGVGPALVRVEYVDRYVRSPVAARSLFEVFRGLMGRPGGIGPGTELRVTTTPNPGNNFRPPSGWRDDWTDAMELRSVLEALMARLTGQCTVNVPASVRGVAHARSLRLAWPGGLALTVRLDQGLGLLRPQAFLPHPFGAPPATQAQAILRANLLVRNEEGSSLMYVMGPSSEVP